MITEDTLVFLDAGFLSKLSKHFGNGKYLVYDISKFSRHISKKQKLTCRHSFYYTAPPFVSGKPSKREAKRKKLYDNFIAKLSKKKDFTIREGRCQRLKIDGKFEYIQKGVDSLVVIDLMNVNINYPKIKKIILIASDSDFVPVIDDLKKKGIKTTLYTYYERGRKAKFSTSNELIKSVDKYVLLTKEDFTLCQLEGIKKERK
ncbi:MAG: NYN domain-containing protein [Nanoarchaeota archaeon]|nr:NYN domain-containing protein [Nanoarchaeota archaeon]